MPRINFVELPTSDLSASCRFYGDAFGFAFTDFGPTYPGGRRFHFRDPGGNELAALKAD